MTPSPLAQSPPWRHNGHGSLGPVATPLRSCAASACSSMIAQKSFYRHSASATSNQNIPVKPTHTLHFGRGGVLEFRARAFLVLCRFSRWRRNLQRKRNYNKLLLSRFISISVSSVAAPACHHMGALLPGGSRFIRGPPPSTDLLSCSHIVHSSCCEVG